MSNKIACFEEGTGETVILISGLGGRGGFWKPVINLLSKNRHVLTFDHPGIGETALHGKPTIEGIAQTVLQLLDERGIAAAHIVGHSTGSLAAQVLALDYPQRVKSLVLSSGWAKPDQRFRDFFAFRLKVLNALGGEAYKALTELTAWPSEWYEGHFATNEIRDFAKRNEVDVVTVNERVEMLLEYSRADELHTLNKLGVLIIGAIDDYIIPYVHARHLNTLIPQSNLVELNGGHFAPVTRTEDYVQVLKKFWETTE